MKREMKPEMRPGVQAGMQSGLKPAGVGTGTSASADDTTAASLCATALPEQARPAAALGATAALLALIALSVAWEWWLAPLRPGGSALVLKALPLLLALPGVWRRRLYTLQWASMLSLLYFAEGVVRGWSDRGLSARLGWLQAALAVIFFVCALAYVAPFKRAAKHAAKETAKSAERQAAADAQAHADARDTTGAETHPATSPAMTQPATQVAPHAAPTAAATQTATGADPDPDPDNRANRGL